MFPGIRRPWPASEAWHGECSPSRIVAARGHPPGRESLVAASFLRADGDTLAARRFRELVEEAGGPGAIERPGMPEDLLRRLAARLEPDGQTRASRCRAALEWARRALEEGEHRQLECLTVGAQAYPDRLWQIPDPPVTLWLRGRSALLGEAAVAIVGARQATPAGLAVATRVARELAEAGLVVVSGMARGIDGAAHQGALDAGGPTVAVLGCGADVVYPGEHEALARCIGESGVLVSEFPPGSAPLPWRFPLRNRIISGLVHAVVVIEASEHSGSLITAKAALEQGRDVLAVPGSVASGRYRGSHALIKDGARLVETVDDVLDEIGWQRAPVAGPSEQHKNNEISWLERLMVAGEDYHLDELVELSRRRAGDVLAELAELEISGRVARRPGGNFAKA